jgi:hypothetical protein
MRALVTILLSAGLISGAFYSGHYLGLEQGRAEERPRPVCKQRVSQWEGIKECRAKCFFQDRMEKVK